MWGEFIADLSRSVDCSADTPSAGKGASVTIPGGKLLGKFDANEATDLHNATHFGELGSTLLHAEPQKSYGIGTCNLMISAHTLKTPIRPEAEQEILFKLKSGFRQGLWPVLHLEDPVGHLEMPSKAAENASQAQLLDGLNIALSAVTSGRDSSLLQGAPCDQCNFGAYTSSWRANGLAMLCRVSQVAVLSRVTYSTILPLWLYADNLILSLNPALGCLTTR